MILDEIYRKSKNSEEKFGDKNVLFIGSECYDASVITILQGLQKLGFKIFTIKKANVNSWFCATVIDDPNSMKFDFVISNLHWGTRWSYYKKFKLDSYLKVLIDGDDTMNFNSWRDKVDYYKKVYVLEPEEEVKNQSLAPYRWMEELNGYEADIVFTVQKQFADDRTFYLPFGIHEEYFQVFKNKSTSQREIDFVHIDGPGLYRRRTRRFLNCTNKLRLFPGNVVNGYVRGTSIVPADIKQFLEVDDNIHSYHRWTMGREYFETLNNAKVLIYPGIDHWSFWDSKRPWEAYASGCLVLMKQPNIDVSEYPITEICDFAVYNSLPELMYKCRILHKNPLLLDKFRREAQANSVKYFSPKPLANYFLRKIDDFVEQ